MSGHPASERPGTRRPVLLRLGKPYPESDFVIATFETGHGWISVPGRWDLSDREPTEWWEVPGDAMPAPRLRIGDPIYTKPGRETP